MDKYLIEIKNLKCHLPIGGDWFSRMFDKRTVKAVDGINFKIEKGKTLGLVGESGSGKTTTGKMIARLLNPSAGEIYYGDIKLSELKGLTLKTFRQRIQMIFQDPSSSLNRRKTAGQIISEPLKIHKLTNSQNLTAKIIEIAENAGLPRRFLNRYPHEMSGGQRQRVGIARALSSNPEFVICDEPVTALDVSVQAQILNLLKDLQNKFNLTFLFIAHDLSVVRYISDNVAVMYLGKIVELANTEQIFNDPKHPYTKALLESVPTPNPDAPKRKILSGEIPSPINPPSGCTFHPRCSKKIGEICEKTIPGDKLLEDGRQIRCHLY